MKTDKNSLSLYWTYSRPVVRMNSVRYLLDIHVPLSYFQIYYPLLILGEMSHGIFLIDGG